MDLAIHGNKRAAIEEKASSIAAFKICIHVDSAITLRGILDQIEPRVELAELVMAATPIADDLDAIEAIVDVRILGDP